MATNVATLTAQLEAEVRGFERDLKKAERRLDRFEKETDKTEKSQRRLNKSTIGLGLAMTGVFAGAAGAAAISFMKDSVKEASDLNESINAVRVTFGESAESILKLGESAAESVGLANSEFNSLAVGFSAFVEQIDRGQGNVAEVMDDLTTRVADFASVMNLDVTEAAEKFRSGLAGETEPLRKFGLDVSAASVNLKALELGLADSSSELDEQDKILARYHLIMEQTEKTAGDFANTSDDLANKQRILSKRWKDAQAAIGEALVPAVEALLEVGEDLIPVLEDMAVGLDAFDVGGKLRDLRIFIEASDALGGLNLKTFDLWVDFGDALDNMADPADALRQTFDRFADLDFAAADMERFVQNAISISGVDDDSLREMARSYEILGPAIGLTSDEIDIIVTALENAAGPVEEAGENAGILGDNMDAARRAFEKAIGPTGDLADDSDDLAEGLINTAIGAEAAAKQAGKMETAFKRLTDPVFAAFDDQQNLNEAIDRFNEVSAPGSEASSADIEKALLDVVEAQIRADSSNRILGESMDESRRAILLAAEAAGFEADEMETLKGILDGFDGQGATYTLFLAFEASSEARRFLEEGNAFGSGETPSAPLPKGTSPVGGITANQFGGHLLGGSPSIVGEGGPELFVPEASGTVINLSQIFQRAEGPSLDSDIARGLILSGISRFIESRP